MKMLTPLEIKKLSSSYISETLKNESWQIDSVQIEENHLTAFISINSTYLSSTDGDQFHVSAFSMIEFHSQLMVIFMHLLTGYSEKTKEVWMAEVNSRSIRPIRSLENIKVEIDLVKMRHFNKTVFFIFESQTTDDQGGLSKHKFKMQLA